MLSPNPDRSFMKDLRLMDKRLGCKFNGEHFVITYDRGYGTPVNIARIKGKDDGFRQPDRRDLEFIRSGDMENDSVRRRLDRISYTAAKEEQMERQAKVKENIKDMTKDDKLQLRRWFSNKYNLSKGNSEFRRINVKPKGKVF